MNPIRIARLLSLLPLLAAHPVLADSAGNEDGAGEVVRSSHSKHYQGDAGTPLVETLDQFGDLPTAGTGKPRSKPHTGKSRAAGPSASLTPNNEFWFYSADVELFRDNDRDGYFAGIDLLFDADTVYVDADVYAVVYLSYEGSDWFEYAATEDFTIFGTSGGDSYNIVTDLLEGYPTGSYDILIELFDAWNGEFVAWIGPEDTSELSFLPLEDRDRDAALGGGTTVVVNRGGGGALGVVPLLLLALLAIARRRSLPM